MVLRVCYDCKSMLRLIFVVLLWHDKWHVTNNVDFCGTTNGMPRTAPTVHGTTNGMSRTTPFLLWHDTWHVTNNVDFLWLGDWHVTKIRLFYICLAVFNKKKKNNKYIYIYI